MALANAAAKLNAASTGIANAFREALATASDNDSVNALEDHSNALFRAWTLDPTDNNQYQYQISEALVSHAYRSRIANQAFQAAVSTSNTQDTSELNTANLDYASDLHSGHATSVGA